MPGEEKAPEPLEEDTPDAELSDYGLYKCGECGSRVMGFGKEEHVRDVHGASLWSGNR